MEYEIIRSSRKTLCLEVREDLTVIVRAPKKTDRKQIESFVLRHEDWLAKALERARKRAAFHRETEAPQREAELRKAAEAYLPKRTAEWAEIMKLSPASVRITGAKTRFGSCSAQNRICFSWRLMAYPEKAVDYVIVHELAHILQKNHSPRFYALIERYLPDWKERREMLKIR